MITYKLPEEKETLLRYAQLLDDTTSLEIVQRGFVKDKQEAIHFAEFFWRVVAESAEQDKANNDNSEYILEKIIVTLMAYFRSAGYEEEWELVCDRN
jgi:hypothetical protein